MGLGRAEAQIAGLREISDNYRRRTMDTLRVAFLSSLALELIATISVAVVAVFIGIRLVYGEIDLLTGLLVLILAPECYLPFRQVGAAFHASEDGIEAMDRAQRVIETPGSVLLSVEPTLDRSSRAELGDLPAAADISISTAFQSAAALMVSDLTVKYGDRSTPAVDGLSFTVEPGEIVALSGPSGSGKSTALAALAGLLGTTANGSVTVTGQMSGLDPERIAWVPQHPEMFAETVWQEIALYSEAHSPLCHSERSEESLSSAFPETVPPGSSPTVENHGLIPLDAKQNSGTGRSLWRGTRCGGEILRSSG